MRLTWGIGAIAFALAMAAPAAAEDAALPDWLAIHGQATFVLQGTPGFASPYAGPNSLTPHQRKETFDATLYAGIRPWRGGELWVNPEVDQGFGLSDTLGVAGFPSAEAYKVGKKHPYTRLQRLFFRQTIDLSGGSETVEAAANQFAGKRAGNRLVVTIGKFSVGDIFDTNKYAHDPRGDFLNWAIVDTGSFDYAADAWGYTTGAAAELYSDAWTLRLGLFNLSKIPNGETLEHRFGQSALVGEIEHRRQIAGRDGAIRVTLFRNQGRFGRFDDALALAGATGAVPDTALVRARRSRSGIAINAEQALTDDIGLFVRAGATDGRIETYDFTDIDRTAAAGLAVAGKRWGRGDDTIGVALLVNDISAARRRYLAAGGIGVLVGDGQLPHAAAEQIGEAYYQLKFGKPFALALDYQHIARPGYNRERGPANVLALRFHGQF